MRSTAPLPPTKAWHAIAERRPDLVLSDIKMPKKDGIELLGDIKRVDATIPVVILTAFASVETAVEAMKRGASDYLTKPISRDDLTMTVAKTLKLHRLEAENEDLRTTLNDRFRFENIIGLSPAMTALFDVLKKVAPTDATVLVTGESGTGKELIAKAIHYNSPRRAHRLVAVNCAAIPHDLLESELFGHVRGAFTGAIRNKIGKFELAHGGTLFLDEIGAMPMTLQAKLLRALQEREIERVGDERTIEVDVRIVAATNRSLPALVAAREFREDLFYRLNVVPVHVPPLRERRGDIPLLVKHFVDRFAGGAPHHGDARSAGRPRAPSLAGQCSRARAFLRARGAHAIARRDRRRRGVSPTLRARARNPRRAHPARHRAHRRGRSVARERVESIARGATPGRPAAYPALSHQEIWNCGRRVVAGGCRAGFVVAYALCRRQRCPAGPVTRHPPFYRERGGGPTSNTRRGTPRGTELNRIALSAAIVIATASASHSADYFQQFASHDYSRHARHRASLGVRQRDHSVRQQFARHAARVLSPFVPERVPRQERSLPERPEPQVQLSSAGRPRRQQGLARPLRSQD